LGALGRDFCFYQVLVNLTPKSSIGKPHGKGILVMVAFLLVITEICRVYCVELFCVAWLCCDVLRCVAL
jgi:hypothetical protein